MGGGRRTEFNFNYMTGWKLTYTVQKEISVSEMNQVFAICLQTKISFHVSFIYPCIIHLIIYSSIYPFIHLFMYSPIHVFIYPCIHLSIHIFIYPCIHLSMYSSIHPSIHLSIYIYMHFFHRICCIAL